jgi:hypothetical protein
LTDRVFADLLKKKKGRKAFVPTDAQRADVARLVADRAHVDAIAAVIGISTPTLRKHFAAELGDTLSGGANLFAAVEQRPPLAALPAPKTDGRGKGGGRPRFEPSREQRGRVMEMIAVGTMDEAAIARAIGVSAPVYRRAFRAEIAGGRQVKRAEVIEMLFRAGRKGSVPALTRLADMMDRADLGDLAEKVRDGADADADRPQRARAEDAVGKKLQAKLDASKELADGEWSGLLGAPDQARPH